MRFCQLDFRTDFMGKSLKLFGGHFRVAPSNGVQLSKIFFDGFRPILHKFWQINLAAIRGGKAARIMIAVMHARLIIV